MENNIAHLNGNSKSILGFQHDSQPLANDNGYSTVLSYPDFTHLPVSSKTPSTANAAAHQNMINNQEPILLAQESARLHLSSQYSQDDNYLDDQNTQQAQKNNDQDQQQMVFEQDTEPDHPDNTSAIDQQSHIIENDYGRIDHDQIFSEVNDAQEPIIASQTNTEDQQTLDAVARFINGRKASVQTDQPVAHGIGQSSMVSPNDAIYPGHQSNQKYESSFDQAETIVRNLPNVDQESFVEVDQAMFELEIQQVIIIRQVVLVQLRRMLSLLEQIQITQSQMGDSQSAESIEEFQNVLQQRKADPDFLHEMVKTCAEAILIELVSDQNSQEHPETNIRDILSKENFQNIVYTWAQELEFEQICSQKVLDQIFIDFDVDCDGVVSEKDLQISIYNMITKIRSKNLQMIQKQSSGHEITQEILQVPELELELESDQESARETERQAEQQAYPVQFESTIKQSGRSNSNVVEVDTLLRLKNASSQDLIIAIQDMQSRQYESNSVLLESEPGQSTNYKDFIYVQEKVKLEQMIKDYQSCNTLQHSPKNNQQLQNENDRIEMIRQTQTKLTAVEDQNDYSFTTSAKPSKDAVHPQDNTSEREPDQPSLASRLNNQELESREDKTSNTLKSQDDREPDMPVITSEFEQSNDDPNNYYEMDSDGVLQNVVIDQQCELQQSVIESPQMNKSMGEEADEENRTTAGAKISMKNRQDNYLYQPQWQLATDSRAIVKKNQQIEENSYDYNLYPEVAQNQLLARPHHGIVTADFGGQDQLNPQSSKVQLDYQLLLNQKSQKQLPPAEDPNDEISGQSYSHNDNIQILLARNAASQEIIAHNSLNDAAFEEQVMQAEIPSNLKSVDLSMTRNPKSLGQSVRSDEYTDIYNNPTKSKVSFSKLKYEDDEDINKQRSVGQQTEPKKTIKLQKQPNQVSRHSLYKSQTNSDFLQSSPEQKSTMQQEVKIVTQSIPTVDMATDPMSVHKVSERQNFGSDYRQNSEEGRKSVSNKSIQASDNSDKLLPGTKIKRKLNEGKNGSGLQNMDLTIPNTFTNQKVTQDQGLKSLEKGNSDSKIPTPIHKRVPNRSQSPILEVDEEKKTKKKTKRKSKNRKNFSSPDTPAQKNQKQKSKEMRQLVQASMKVNQNKTSGFDAKRKVDFSDVDEMIHAEVHAAMTVTESKKNSTWRLRKPNFNTAGQQFSPVVISQLNKRGDSTQSDLLQDEKNQDNSSLPSNIRQNKNSGSPSRVYKTNAKNELQQSFEVMPKELMGFNKPAKNESLIQLQPLNKRLAQARLNGLSNNTLVQEYTASAENSKEQKPIQSIDWGPEPDPIYSSQMLSQDDIRSMQSIPENQTINGDQPYQNFPQMMSGFGNFQTEKPPLMPTNKSKLTTAQQPTRSRLKFLQKHSPDEVSQNESYMGGPFERENFANLREEHNRTSMLIKRPTDKLNINSHLYVDEKLGNIANIPQTQSSNKPNDNDVDLWQKQYQSGWQVSRDGGLNLQDHPWLKEGVQKPSGIRQRLHEPHQDQVSVAAPSAPKYLIPMAITCNKSAFNMKDKRSMSNLTKKQINEGKIRKGLKQQGLIPGGEVTTSSFLAQQSTSNQQLFQQSLIQFESRRSSHQQLTSIYPQRSVSTNIAHDKVSAYNTPPVRQQSKQKSHISTSQQSSSNQQQLPQAHLPETLAESQHTIQENSSGSPDMDATLIKQGLPNSETNREEDIVIIAQDDNQDYLFSASPHISKEIKEEGEVQREGEESQRTARRSQQNRNENIAVSIMTTSKAKHEEGQTQRKENAYDDTMQSSRETRAAQVSHSIDVGRARKNNFNLTQVRKQMQQAELYTISPRQTPSSQEINNYSISTNTHEKNNQPLANYTNFNQVIRERNERRYAAYSKKNVVSMYRSINENKKRGKVVKDSALYQSLPQLNDSTTVGENYNSVKVANGHYKNILSQDESRTAFVAQHNLGSIEIAETISESGDTANQDYRMAGEQQIGNIAIQNRKFMLEQNQNRQRQQPRNSSLPTLPKDEGTMSQKYLVAQAHQRKQFVGTTSKIQYKNEFPTKAQLRYHMNQDLMPVQRKNNDRRSDSPIMNKYQILATQQKSHSVLHPFVTSSVLKNSHTSLQRVPSNQFNLREQSKSDIQIKNMFVHKAIPRKSPDLLPMEFENRHTVTSMQESKVVNKQPAIAPVGIHGALQAKFNNASAKLLANYDYKRQKQQMNAKSQGARHVKANELLSKNNSNLRLVQIPQKIEINSKFD